MWIIFKFFGILIGWNHWLWIRRKKQLGSATFIEKAGEITGYVFIRKNKTVLKMELAHDLAFKFSPETTLDRLFKSLGISNEMEVGDSGFDKKFYLGSSSQELVRAIAEKSGLKQSIVTIFKDLALKIEADSRFIEVTYYGERRDLTESIKALALIVEWINKVPTKNISQLRDPFYLKILAAEFWISGIAIYGFVSFVEHMFSARVIIDLTTLISWAILALAAALLVGVPLFLFTLRRAARSHQILIENMTHLLVGFPLAAFFLMADLNRSLDQKDKEIFTLPVLERDYYFTTHVRLLFRRYLGPYRTVSKYALKVDLSDFDGAPPYTWVKVNYQDSQASIANAYVGEGYLGARYIEKFRFE